MPVFHLYFGRDGETLDHTQPRMNQRVQFPFPPSVAMVGGRVNFSSSFRPVQSSIGRKIKPSPFLFFAAEGGQK